VQPVARLLARREPAGYGETDRIGGLMASQRS